ncbi:hypothetical protein FQN50_006796 [Emmonsiellopsis sp. PD_5]|nr:hypothetical protein FQN50_006796 [Emmonsiellopsis sp. PD_5]
MHRQRGSQSPIRDQSAPSIVVPSVFMAVFIPLVLLRLFTRIVVVKSGLGWDDWATILLTVVLIPGNVMSIVLAHLGLGKDIWTIEFQNITKLLYIFYIQEFLYVSAIAITKLAFLFFYASIFPTAHKMRWLIKGTGVVTICYGVGCLFAFAFQCSPISFNWNGWDGEHAGTCVKKNDLIMAAGIINVVLDAWVIALPIPALMKLQMSTGRKLQIISMFSLGFLITGISSYRVAMLKIFATSSNATWDHATPGFWSLAEVDVGLVCLCLPPIRPLLSHYFPKVFGSRPAGSSRTLTGPQSVGPKTKRGELELGSNSNNGGSFVQLIDMDKGNGKVYGSGY